MRRYLQILGRMLYIQRNTNRPQKAPSTNFNHLLKTQFPTQLQTNIPEHGPTRKSKESEEKKIECRNPMYRSTFDQIFHSMIRSTYKPNNKITVVGAGEVGMATVFSLLAKGIANDVSMVDFSEDVLKGELMDLQSGSKFLPNAKIRASKDYAISSESKICVLTPSAKSKFDEDAEGEGDSVKTNAEVLKLVVPQLLKYSPDAIILVAIDPVDVLSYLTWRVSDLPKSRVIGSGTNLSSATFRFLLADRLGLAPASCNGYIIGENGESCVPVWSSVTVGGVHLQDLNPDIGSDKDPENWQEIYWQVRNSRQKVRSLKGGSSWATALSISDICAAILNDTNCIRPVSTYVKGEHNISEEVFLSLPCVVGSAGVTDIIKQPLTLDEVQLLHKSAEIVAKNQGSITIAQ